MPPIQLLDTPSPLYFFYFGLIVVTLIFLFTVFIEAIIIYLMKWGPALYCLAASLLANLSSAAVGIKTTRFVGSVGISWSFADHELPLAPFLLANWLLTMIIETPIFVVLNRKQLSIGIKAAAAANVASYLMNAVFLALMAMGFSA